MAVMMGRVDRGLEEKIGVVSLLPEADIVVGEAAAGVRASVEFMVASISVNVAAV